MSPAGPVSIPSAPKIVTSVSVFVLSWEIIASVITKNLPVWAFTIGTLGQYVYDNTNSINFELDTSEQVNIILNILKYAGVIIQSPEIIQTATQEAAKIEQNEKS